MDWGSTFLWAQIVGFLAMSCCIISMQFKTSKQMILAAVPANSLWAGQYMLLGAPMGAIANLGSAINKLLIVILPQNFVPYLLGFYLISIWSIGLYNLEMWYALLPLMGATITTIPLIIDRDNRPMYARATILGCLLWACYNATVGSYMGLACDTLTITSCLIGIYRHEEWNLNRSPRILFKFLFTAPTTPSKESSHV
jgi:hypothetical protein